MDPGTIKSFIDAMAASDLAEMEFSEGGWTLRLVRRAAPDDVPPARAASTPRPASASPSAPTRADAAQPAVTPEQPKELRSPMFGVVYLAPSPGAPPFVAPGARVEAGDTVCIIEAMKVFQEVRADRAGIVAAIVVAAGDEVEAGQVIARFA